MGAARRATTATIAAGLAVLACVGLSSAKDGTVARLDGPLPTDAQPGEVVTIGWVLGYEEDGVWMGVSMCDPSLSVFSPGASAPLRVHAGGCGPHFVVNFAVPSGGFDRVEIGLGGMDIPIVAPQPAAQATSAVAQDDQSGSVLGFVLVGAALVALSAAGLFLFRSVGRGFSAR